MIEANVRVTASRIPWWKVIIDFNKPKPSHMKCDILGITISRKDGLQDETVLQGHDQISIKWANVAGLYFNKWLEKEITVTLYESVSGINELYVYWYEGYYYLKSTDKLYSQMVILRKKHDTRVNL